MSDDERAGDDGRSEAQVRMEQELKRRKEKAAEEMAEYEEMRREQREKEAEEIRELREKREQRKQERAEEEKRLAELRAQEDHKRRAEEEERQRKKKEEETRKREEREAKRREHEERTKRSGPNFKISKKSADGSASRPEEEGAAEKKPTKSKEQLDAERKSELEKRFHKVDTTGMSADVLREKAKELHQLLYRLESDKYDLIKRFEQQNYDMQALAERARQMSKGGGKKNVNVNTAPDPLAAKFSGVPPKVTMYSQYERVKDHRSFSERSDCFKGPLYAEEFHRIEPSHKVIMTEMGAKYVDAGSDDHHGGGNKPAENGTE